MSYSPRHAIVRAVRSLPKWARAAILGAAASGSIAGLAVAALPSGASVAPTVYTGEQAGYAATGAQFKSVTATVYLRKATQYASELQGYGYSVQLWSGGQLVVLGVSDSTASSPYSPGIAVFNPETHATICAENAACGDNFGATSFPAGHTVRLSLSYNRASGNVTAAVTDLTAGTSTTSTYQAGTGVSFRQARVGAEDGITPFDNSVSYNHPAAAVKWGRFTAATVHNYKGKAFSLSQGQYFGVGQVLMTSNGTPGGALEAAPASLSGGAFNVNLH